MHQDRTIHDIEPGTLFRFYPGLRLYIFVAKDNSFRYVYEHYMGDKGAFDDKVISYMGTHRVSEGDLPVTKKRRKIRLNVRRLKPAFLMAGKLILLESMEYVFPFEGQGNIYKEDN